MNDASQRTAWRPWGWALPILVAAAVLGGICTRQVARQADREMRSRLLTEARMVAQAVDVNRVLNLSGSDADLDHADYRRLKEQLTLVRAANPAVRFVYLLGQRPGGAVFLFVDSESPDSPDYSPPGQHYAEASAICEQVFVTRKEIADGPVTDRWGTWVSGLVPLADPRTKALIAVLGVDVDARDWKRAIAGRCVAPIAVTAIILLLLVVAFVIHNRSALEHRRLAATAAAIRESHEQLRIILDTVPAGVILVDAESRTIADANPAALKLIGAPRAAVVGQVWQRVIGPADTGDGPAPDLAQTADGSEQLLRTADGRTRPILTTVRPLMLDGRKRLIGSFVDLSGLKQKEAELQQQHTLASIGTLARGMAHEINNPIMGAMNYAQLIRDKAADNATLAAFADEILAESRRVATLTHGLLGYAEQAQLQAPACASLSGVVASALPSALAEAQARGIALTCDLPADLPPVPCRQRRMWHLVTALLTNALEAWDEAAPAPAARGDGRDKAICLRARTFDKAGQAWVRLTVEDNGPGIREEIRERVFDPFFTTKDRTQHAGLGLWIARTVAQEHGGELRVESPSTALRAGEGGRGTRFRSRPATVKDDNVFQVTMRARPEAGAALGARGAAAREERRRAGERGERSRPVDAVSRGLAGVAGPPR